MSLLEVRGLRTSFFIRSGELRVIDGLDFELEEGEVVGLVGETGSPVGDHARSETSVKPSVARPSVSWRTFEPSRSATYSCGEPVVSVTNAIRFPSGDGLD